MRFLDSLRTINRDKQPKSMVVYLLEMGENLVCQQPNSCKFTRVFLCEKIKKIFEKNIDKSNIKDYIIND